MRKKAIKRCQPTHKKTYGFESCGEIKEHHQYGICKSCFKIWLDTTENGKEYFSNALTISKPRAEKEIKKQETEKKRSKINYAGKLQETLQEIARLIDLGHECIATNKMAISYDGGHVYGKNSHRECRFNLHNIFAQSSNSNRSQEDDILMIEGIERVFGIEYKLFIETFKNKPIIKHSKQDYERMYRKARKWANSLSKQGKKHTIMERVEVRNQINIDLGVYPIELCVFKKTGAN